MTKDKLELLIYTELSRFLERENYTSPELDLIKNELKCRMEEKTRRHFRELKKWDVVLKTLYGLMWVEEVTVADLADEIDCSARSIQRYIFEGAPVPYEIQQAISEFFGRPVEIIFYDLFN